MSTIAALDLSGRPGLRLNLNNLDRLISDWDLLSTPLPLQSLNLAPILNLVPPPTLIPLRPGMATMLKGTSTGVGIGCAMLSWIIKSHPHLYTIVATRP